ncbi:hypothetical protein [Clostridium lundense]|nr:hypothetical protein [Clostridium lundense]
MKKMLNIDISMYYDEIEFLFFIKELITKSYFRIRMKRESMCKI